MREILTKRNNDLMHEFENLLQLAQNAQIPVEMEPYQALMMQCCLNAQDMVKINQGRLKLLDQVDIIEDILSETQQLTQTSRTLGAILIPPILRASDEDSLVLKIIAWLHRVHPKTVHLPPVVENRHWSVLPFDAVPLYYLPCLDQRGLLYQPLLFHEFGHVLYAIHRQELDDLVLELQEKILDSLLPASQRNDRYAQRQSNQYQIIADTWYSWIEELFCDVVGITIGGPSYLQASSTVLSTLQTGDFSAREEELQGSSHPVKWLRIQLLSRYAKKMGFPEQAQKIIDIWGRIAHTLEIQEDYHGFYDPVLDDAIMATIDDMIEETNPRKILDIEITESAWSATTDSPIQLLNFAWKVYLQDSESYPAWEAEQIEYLLNNYPSSA